MFVFNSVAASWQQVASTIQPECPLPSVGYEKVKRGCRQWQEDPNTNSCCASGAAWSPREDREENLAMAFDSQASSSAGAGSQRAERVVAGLKRCTGVRAQRHRPSLLLASAPRPHSRELSTQNDESWASAITAGPSNLSSSRAARPVASKRLFRRCRTV
eukprot:6205217-Pleurochrysis_carterae.AAC.3